MKKVSKIFSYKLGWPCALIMMWAPLIDRITGVGVRWFTALAVVCGLVGMSCFFAEMIKALQEEKASKANSEKGSDV